MDAHSQPAGSPDAPGPGGGRPAPSGFVLAGPRPPVRSVRDAGSPLLAAVSWVIALLICGAIFVENHAEAPKAAPGAVQAEAVPPAGLLDPLARLVMGSPAEQRAEVSQILSAFGDGPAARVRLSVLEAENRGAEAGIAAIDKAMAEIKPESPLAIDAAAFRELYVAGPGALDAARVDGLRARHGFFARLALTRGMDETAPARAAVLEEGAQTFRRVLALEVGGFLGLGLMVFAAFVTAVVFVAMGRVRPSLAAPLPGGSVFIEAFAAFMLAMIAMRAVGPLARDALGPVAILAQWLVAPVVFYPLLRRVPWLHWKFALGWHKGKGVLREIGAGIVGYLACLPIVFLGIVCTLLLGVIRTWYKGAAGEPPTHPIGELLGSANAWQIAAIASLAVVWAPVVEESMFRGALYHHLRGRLHWVVAGVLQGVIFAAVHPQGWLAIPALGSIGLVMSMLREWRTSLIAPVTAHALNNGTIVTLLIIVMNL